MSVIAAAVLEIMACGMKGLAAAVFGESPNGFFAAPLALDERKEGVKLGESTLRDFLDRLQSNELCRKHSQ